MSICAVCFTVDVGVRVRVRARAWSGRLLLHRWVVVWAGGSSPTGLLCTSRDWISYRVPVPPWTVGAWWRCQLLTVCAWTLRRVVGHDECSVQVR